MTTPNVFALQPASGALMVDMSYTRWPAGADALNGYIITLAAACSVRSDGHDDDHGRIAALEIIGQYLQCRLTQTETINSLKGLYRARVDDADAGSEEA